LDCIGGYLGMLLLVEIRMKKCVNWRYKFLYSKIVPLDHLAIFYLIYFFVFCPVVYLVRQKKAMLLLT